MVMEYPKSISCINWLPKPEYLGDEEVGPPCGLIDIDGLKDKIGDDLLTFICCVEHDRPEMMGKNIHFSLEFHHYDLVSVLDQHVEVTFHFANEIEGSIDTEITPDSIFISDEQELNELGQAIVTKIAIHIYVFRPSIIDAWNVSQLA